MTWIISAFWEKKEREEPELVSVDLTASGDWKKVQRELYDHHGSGLVSKSCPILATPWTVASQSPLSVRFSRQ